MEAAKAQRAAEGPRTRAEDTGWAGWGGALTTICEVAARTEGLNTCEELKPMSAPWLVWLSG